MKKNIKLSCFSLLLVLLSINLLRAQHTPVEGKVMDAVSREPLIGATVILLPDTLGTQTDSEGYFRFPAEAQGTYLLVRYIGYAERRVPAKTDFIELMPRSQLLEAVEVHAEHFKQEASLSHVHLGVDFFRERSAGTVATSLQELPGLNAINTGVGIAKPVIRGLSFNRIIVNHNGIKQEGQQWGADHGLEIDPFAVEQVEVIKGPASLQYGSDGLGGVINIQPGALPEEGKLSAEGVTVYKSNNRHWGHSARVSGMHKGWFAEARWSSQRFGDYRVPEDQFEYNEFNLPIVNQRLKNTAGEEQNLLVSAGFQNNRQITRLSFSHYDLNAGFFSGAVGIPRSYTLEDDGNTRDIDLPRQEVDHYKFSIHQTLFLGEDHLNWNLGYQRNLRQERSFPEFHSTPLSQLEPGYNVGIALDLETWSMNAHYEYHPSPGWKLVPGLDLQYQRNQRDGFAFLLPDFQTWRSGAYFIAERKLGREGAVWNGGVRLDYAWNQSDPFTRYVYDSRERITDSLAVPLTDDPFFNFAASSGFFWPLQKEGWAFKINLGKSFRVPYPSETVSNGVHHGTFRHEQGQPDLKPEHGYQLDVGLQLNGLKWKADIAAFGHFIDQFIYLRPSARFSRLPEAGQIFEYIQHDAVYLGGELAWQWEPQPAWEWSQSLEYVWNRNLDTRLPLPFTPPALIHSSLRYSWQNAPKWLANNYISATHRYSFAQNRVDRNEDPTPAYQWFSFTVGGQPKFGKIRIQWSLQLLNALDTRYLHHLSRYRLLQVPEQGRNWVFTLRIGI